MIIISSNIIFRPLTRRNLIRPATIILHTMTKKFPFVAFHQSSQLVATPNGSSVTVFDLRTSSVARIFQGQGVSCVAIAFDIDGNRFIGNFSGHVDIYRRGFSIILFL
jgi:hypothetical protein